MRMIDGFSSKIRSNTLKCQMYLLLPSINSMLSVCAVQSLS